MVEFSRPRHTHTSSSTAGLTLTNMSIPIEHFSWSEPIAPTHKTVRKSIVQLVGVVDATVQAEVPRPAQLPTMKSIPARLLLRWWSYE